MPRCWRLVSPRLRRCLALSGERPRPTGHRGLAGTDDLERDLRAFARQFMHALMPPAVLRLPRLVIANADRFPEMGRAWYAHGFERALAALTEQFRRLTLQRLLDADDPEMAAQHFVGLLLWIPVNKVMFSGESAAPSAEDLNH